MSHPVTKLILRAADGSPTKELAKKDLKVRETKAEVQHIVHIACVATDAVAHRFESNRQVQEAVMEIIRILVSALGENAREALYFQLIVNEDLNDKLRALPAH